MMMTMTRIHSPEGAELQARRFHGDDSELEHVQPLAAASAPASLALRPDVEAERVVDAAAIREEEAKMKEKLWRKAKQSAVNHKQRHAQTNIEKDDQEEKIEKEKKEERHMKMGERKQHHLGHKTSQDSLRVNNILLLA